MSNAPMSGGPVSPQGAGKQQESVEAAVGAPEAGTDGQWEDAEASTSGEDEESTGGQGRASG